MTKLEIANLIGLSQTIIHGWFREAESECESIKAKKNHYSKMLAVDYTLEETLIAIKHYPRWTPMLARYIEENFIHRDTPNAIREPKKRKLRPSENRFIYRMKNNLPIEKCCNVCGYIRARSTKKVGTTERPYCEFYEIFLHKALPKRDVYKDCCPTFFRSKSDPFIWTDNGAVKFSDYNKVNKDFYGIKHEEFKSKRGRNEPITLLQEIELL